jgi:integrase
MTHAGRAHTDVESAGARMAGYTVFLPEVLGLKWSDFDFDALTVIVQRGVVHGS